MTFYSCGTHLLHCSRPWEVFSPPETEAHGMQVGLAVLSSFWDLENQENQAQGPSTFVAGVHLFVPD